MVKWGKKEEKQEQKPKHPIVMELKPGTYYWCACGKSKEAPFCDDSHESLGMGTMCLRVDVTQTKKVTWCNCSRSYDPPNCDGSHKNAE